ncbi:MAG: 30S ribosomal protein S6 [Ktedonobacterales bacterium]|nr:30S ribosomal protein S6 [Ktedonobacterales bacterium]
MIREYELGLVINPDLSEEQIEAQVLRVGQTIEGRGGQIVHLDRWGRRRMAYPIQRHRDGYYAFFDVQLDSAEVRGVETVLRVQESIMRSLLTVIDPRTIADRRRRQEQEALRLAQRAEAAAAAAQAAANPPAVEATVPAETDAPATPLAEDTPTPTAAETATAPVETAAPEEAPAAAAPTPATAEEAPATEATTPAVTDEVPSEEA